MSRSRDRDRKQDYVFRSQVENRQWTDVICADCGTSCKVPFFPDGHRPVYCQSCYQKHKPERFS